ncbi:MAG: DUF86 domain-containing protein [Chloroflexota bacterium]|nr:MAG: DUF86 domain-containing protein [Chloroflexota bacterium]
MSPLSARERDLTKCEDMRIYAGRAHGFLRARSWDDFLADELLQAAVIRCIEVIGEAARQVSEDTRQRVPGIPWSLIIGMRNVLAHDYGAVDLDRVYRVTTDDLPQLIERLGELISTLESEVGWREDENNER